MHSVNDSLYYEPKKHPGKVEQTLSIAAVCSMYCVQCTDAYFLYAVNKFNKIEIL